MTINFDSSRKLVFLKSDDAEIEITKFDPIPNQESTTARAKEILHLYGGHDKYQPISPTTQFSPDGTYCLARDENDYGLPSPPLQEFPDGSPLDLVKKELAKNDDAIKPVTFFSNGDSLTAEQIKQIKKDQKNVVRLAVKSRLVGEGEAQLSEDEIKQKCFADKEASGRRLSKENYGLMSSYIAPTTFYLNQSGDKAAQKADKETRAYITGFGYPLFNKNYIDAIGSNQNQQKKDELKAIFKQQIYAVLLSRQQQIDSGTINEDIKVPLILNKAHDFVRVDDAGQAEELQQFINNALVELFKEQEVADAMKGKIDKVLFLDGVKTFVPYGGSQENVKFFGDITPIKNALQDSGSGVEALNIDGHDMISVAQAYQEGSGAMIAIPIMANPRGQDGEGSMKGLNAAEESFNIAMRAMMQMLLNSEHNRDLKGREIKDSTNLSCFKTTEVEVEIVREGGATPVKEAGTRNHPSISEQSGEEVVGGGGGNGGPPINSNPQPTFQDNLTSWGVPIGVGLAGAGVVVLCASALGLGIVSAPVVAVAVVVGVACAGATAVTMQATQDRRVKQNR